MAFELKLYGNGYERLTGTNFVWLHSGQLGQADSLSLVIQ